ncbi:MATE family efflux transporter [Polyangium aurulentum]|uniref:MATE family efflux transporter n=1 Tax=Polyangium aurulentum TaxID=2567896 RepID=UPI00146A1D35|nr:MATE family efflux transporter [Polyangium aurulentum]UQA63019.1 MATE family efflux transporter [Polyangium aurulentum]
MNAPAHAPTLRKLLDLAWPIIISRSAQTVIGFCDAAMVARLGEDALAATTAGALNVYAVFILPMGISSIVASFVSQLHGRGDHTGARRYGFYGLIVAALAQILCLGVMLAAPYFFAQLEFTPAVRTLLVQYSVVRLWSGGAAIGLEALANYYGGLGNTRLPMAAQVLAMVLNVVLCWVFIYGNLGAPALGVAGSALAGTIATCIAFVALLGCFLAGYGVEKAPRSPLRGSELWRVLRYGLPAGLNWFVEFSAFNFFINVVIAGLGTTTVAALMAAMQVNSIAFMPAFGIASAGAILVGHALGAKEQGAVPPTVWLTMRVAGGWMGLIGLIYLLFSHFVMLPFAPPGPERAAFLAISAKVLGLSIAWQLVDAAALTFAESLRAAGDTSFPMWARVVIAWLVFVPGSYVSVRMYDGGMNMAVFWLVAYMGLLALVLWLRFRSGVWRSLDLAGSSEMPPI